MDIEFYKEQLEAKEDMLARTTRFLLETQKDLEQKNQEVSELYKNVLDSIQVAQRIQDALLPNIDILKSYFKDAAYYVKQQSGVGGDSVFVKNNNEGVVFGILDSTGHGVPAAMLNISCTLLLRELSSSIEINNPKALFNLLDYQLEKTFNKDEEHSVAEAEGIILGYSSHDNTLSYCSAKGRGFLILNSGELIELEKDQKSIGDASEIMFQNIPLCIDEAKTLLIYSDGLTDQFGGKNDKRFSKNRLKNLIEKNYEADAQTLAKILQFEHNAWRNTTQQTDDISFLIIDF
ncbi:MAG: hypothetical protein EAZ55_01015 [Cytophagales bacterium]|nr:MAG: hypothetical protein EAZ55_01015 [Cytophagales bacterium]